MGYGLIEKKSYKSTHEKPLIFCSVLNRAKFFLPSKFHIM